MRFDQPVEIAFGATRAYNNDGGTVDDGETTYVEGGDEIQASRLAESREIRPNHPPSHGGALKASASPPPDGGRRATVYRHPPKSVADARRSTPSHRAELQLCSRPVPGTRCLTR